MARKSPYFAKIHPNLFESDKFRKMNPQTFLDWVRILLHCVRNESDGFISLIAARDLAQDESIRDLIERNLLDPARLDKSTDVPEVVPEALPEGVSTIEEKKIELEENRKLFISGYLIHDYTDHQTPKADIEARRDIERKKSQARRNKAAANARSVLEDSKKGLGEVEGWSGNDD